MASAIYEQRRQEKNVPTAWLVHIHFDEFQSLPEKDFYFSSTKNMEINLDTGTNEIRGLLSAFPLGRHQRDRGNDYAEFVLVNPNNTTYQDFVDYQPIIERGELTIYQCLLVDKNFWEGEIRFVGYLKEFTLNEADKTLDFTAMSDMSRTGFAVGVRILTRERCGTEFNTNGLNSALYHACGWQTSQGGNATFCSKYLKGADGCISHGNAHRFYALPALSVADITFVQDGTVDFPYETGSCFTKNMFVVLPDWSITPINRLRENDFVMGFEISTGILKPTKILQFERHFSENVINAEFSLGTVETTPEHLFRKKNAIFAPIGALRGKFVEGLCADKSESVNKIENISKMEDNIVYNYRTELNTYIVTDEQRSFYWQVHNNKQRTPIYF